MAHFSNTNKSNKSNGGNKATVIKHSGSNTQSLAEIKRQEAEREAQRNADLAENAKALGVEEPTFEAVWSIASGATPLTEEIKVIVDSIKDACNEIGYKPAEDFFVRPFIAIAPGVIFRRTFLPDGKTWKSMETLKLNGKDVTEEELVRSQSASSLTWNANVKEESGDDKVGIKTRTQELQLKGYFVAEGGSGYITLLGLNWNSVEFEKFLNTVQDFDHGNKIAQIIAHGLESLKDLLLICKYQDPNRRNGEEGVSFINPKLLMARSRRGIVSGLLTKQDYYRFVSFTKPQWLDAYTANATDDVAKLEVEKHYGQEAFNAIWSKSQALKAGSGVYSTDSKNAPAPAPTKPAPGGKPATKARQS